jgi:iron complex outermembrane receptor protein
MGMGMNKALLLGTAAGLLMMPGTAFAQAEVEEASIGDIVVTAQKRAQRAQDVPIAISALDQNAIERMGLTNIADVKNSVPALSIVPYPQGSSMLVVTIRGIGQIDPQQIALDPGVGIYLDDIYMGRGQGITTDLGDIERVEILRGPQGTLYGRNTTGGAVKFITAKPTGIFSVKQTVEAGSFGHRRSVTNLNLPEFANLSVKLTYLHADYGGWVKNSGTGGNFGEKNEDGVRVALRWRPTDDLTADYSFDYADHRGTSAYQQQQYSNGLFPFAFPLFADRQERAWRPVNAPMRDDFKTRGHALNVAWDVTKDLNIRSITFYRELEVHQLVDSVEAFNIPSALLQNLDHRQFSQELILSGDIKDAGLAITAGAFYFRERGIARDSALANGFGLAFINPYPGIVLADFAPLGRADATNKAAAIYANLGWTPGFAGDRLTITLGGRYSWDSRFASRISAPAGSRTSYSSFDPSVTLDYKLSRQVMAYVKYSTAYRAGGFNLRNTNLTPFGPENLRAWEAGLKTSWWDGRLVFNIAVFDQTFRDIQIQFLNPGTSPLQVTSVNAGRQKTRGFEIDTELRPVDGLRLHANVSHLDAGTIDAVNPFTQIPVVTLPAYSPRWAYSLGGEYAVPLGNVGTLTASLDYSHTGRMLAGGSSIAELNKAYGLLNARLTLGDISVARAKMAVSLWGRNLADVGAQSGYHSFGAVIFGEPRAYGVTATFNY